MSREIELENGEVISPVTRVAVEESPLEVRRRRANDPKRNRTSVERRVYIHTPGSGYRVTEAKKIIRDSKRRKV